MNYPIDTGIPPPAPPRRSAVNYAAMPLRVMAPGESFLIKPEEYGERNVHGIAAQVRLTAHRMGVRIRTEVRNNAKHGETGLRIFKQ